MRKTLPIIGLLSDPKLFPVFAVVSGIVFYINYYAMANFPSSDGFQCLVGGNFTPFNIIFSALISLAAGLLAAGFVALYSQRNKLRSIKVGSTSTLGVFIGSITTFCTFCAIPTLSFFGIGIGLGFITEYQLYLKVASFLLLSLALYQLNRQLKGECGRCIN